MIYLDTSVVLAELLAEKRHPEETFWKNDLISSRLLEYEVRTRLHRDRLEDGHGEAATALLRRIGFLDLSTPIVDSALDPLPFPVRTLDRLHLASIEFLRSQRVKVHLASYDDRMITAAREMGIPTHSL